MRTGRPDTFSLNFTNIALGLVTLLCVLVIAGGVARELLHLFPSGAPAFEAMRDEAAISRLYKGIHYRSDIEAGKEHGSLIGAHTVRFSREDGAD